jgi:hypothetical protein
MSDRKAWPLAAVLSERKARLPNRSRAVLSWLLLLTMASASCVSSGRKSDLAGPVPAPSASVTAEQTPPAVAPSDARSSKAKTIVYAVYAPHNNVEPRQEPGIWLYDTTSNDIKHLISFSDRGPFFGEPRFHTESEISFIVGDRNAAGGDSIDLFNIQTGRRRRLFGLASADILSCDWRPDGGAIACIEANFTTDSVHKVVVHGLDGSTRTLKSIGVPGGRDCCQDDEVSVTWSQDGDSLLIVDTHVDYTFNQGKSREANTVRILDMEGRDLIDPLRGTQARWSPDERFLYMREWNGAGAPGHWFRLELSTGKRLPLGMRSAGYDASLSPDGRNIAYLFSGSLTRQGPSEARNLLYIYDLDSNSDRRLENGFQGPIWIAPGIVVATRVEECRAGAGVCPTEGWLGRGAWSIPIDGSTPKPLELGSTLFGSVDVLYE